MLKNRLSSFVNRLRSGIARWIAPESNEDELEESLPYDDLEPAPIFADDDPDNFFDFGQFEPVQESESDVESDLDLDNLDFDFDFDADQTAESAESDLDQAIDESPEWLTEYELYNTIFGDDIAPLPESVIDHEERPEPDFEPLEPEPDDDTPPAPPPVNVEDEAFFAMALGLSLEEYRNLSDEARDALTQIIAEDVERNAVPDWPADDAQFFDEKDELINELVEEGADRESLESLSIDQLILLDMYFRGTFERDELKERYYQKNKDGESEYTYRDEFYSLDEILENYTDDLLASDVFEVIATYDADGNLVYRVYERRTT